MCGVILPDEIALDVESDHFDGIGNGLGKTLKSFVPTDVEGDVSRDTDDDEPDPVGTDTFSTAFIRAASIMSETPVTCIIIHTAA